MEKMCILGYVAIVVLLIVLLAELVRDYIAESLNDRP